MSDDNSRPDPQQSKLSSTHHDEEDDDITRLIRNINSNPTGAKFEPAAAYSSSEENLSNLSDNKRPPVEHQSKLDESFDELENIDHVISDVISDFNQKERNFDYVQRNMALSSPAVASTSDFMKVEESSENLLSSITSSENVRNKSGGDENFYSSTNIYSTDSNEDTYRDEMKAELSNLVDKFIESPFKRSTTLLDDTIKSDIDEGNKSEFNNVADTFIEAETLPSASDKSEFNTVIARFTDEEPKRTLDEEDSLKEDSNKSNQNDVQDDSLNDSTNNDVDEFKRVVDTFIESRPSQILDESQDSIDSEKLDLKKKLEPQYDQLDDSLKSVEDRVDLDQSDANFEKSIEEFDKVVDKFVESKKLDDDENESSLGGNHELVKSSHSLGESYLDNSIHSEDNLSQGKIEKSKEEDVNDISTTSSSSDGKENKSDHEEHSAQSENDLLNQSDKADTPPTSPIELKESDVVSFNKIADEFIQATESLKSAKNDSDSEQLLDDSLTREENKHQLDESIKSDINEETSNTSIDRPHDTELNKSLSDSSHLHQVEQVSKHDENENQLNESSISDKLKEELNESNKYSDRSQEDQVPGELKEFATSIGNPLARSSIDFEKEERDEQPSQVLDESINEDREASRDASLIMVDSENKQQSLNEQIREEPSDEEQSDFNKLADKFIEYSETRSPNDSLDNSQLDQSNSDANEAQHQDMARALSRFEDKPLDQIESDLDTSNKELDASAQSVASARDVSDVKKIADEFIETPVSLDSSREDSINHAHEQHDLSDLKEESGELTESSSNQPPKENSSELEKSESDPKLIEEQVSVSADQSFDQVADRFIGKAASIDNSLESSATEDHQEDVHTKEVEPELKKQEDKLSETHDILASVDDSIDEEKLASSVKSLDHSLKEPLDESQSDVEDRIVESVKVATLLKSEPVNEAKDEESGPHDASLVEDEQAEFNQVVDEFVKRDASPLDKSLDRSSHEQSVSTASTDEDINQLEDNLKKIAELSDESLDSSLNMSLKRSTDHLEDDHDERQKEPLKQADEASNSHQESKPDDEPEELKSQPNLDDSSSNIKLHQMHQIVPEVVEESIEKSEPISEPVNELDTSHESHVSKQSHESELDRSATEIKPAEDEQAEFNQLVDHFIQKEVSSNEASLDNSLDLSAPQPLNESVAEDKHVESPRKTKQESETEEIHSEAESTDSSLNLSIKDSNSSLVRIVQEVLSTQPAIVEENLDHSTELKPQEPNVDEPPRQVIDRSDSIASIEAKQADFNQLADNFIQQTSLNRSAHVQEIETKHSESVELSSDSEVNKSVTEPNIEPVEAVRLDTSHLTRETPGDELNSSQDSSSHGAEEPNPLIQHSRHEVKETVDTGDQSLEHDSAPVSNAEISVRALELSTRSEQEAPSVVESENNSLNSSTVFRDDRISDQSLARHVSEIPEIRFEHEDNSDAQVSEDPTLNKSIEVHTEQQGDQTMPDNTQQSDPGTPASDHDQLEFNQLVEKFIENEDRSGEESLDSSLNLSVKDSSSSLVRIVQEVLSTQPESTNPENKLDLDNELKSHDEPKVEESPRQVVKEPSDEKSIEESHSGDAESANDSKSISQSVSQVDSSRESSELNIDIKPHISDQEQAEFDYLADKFIEKVAQSNEASLDNSLNQSAQQSLNESVSETKQIDVTEFGQLADKFIERTASVESRSEDRAKDESFNESTSVHQLTKADSVEEKLASSVKSLNQSTLDESQSDVEARTNESVRIATLTKTEPVVEAHNVSAVDDEQVEFNKVVDKFIERGLEKSLDSSARNISKEPEPERKDDESLNTSLDASVDHSASLVVNSVSLSQIPVESSQDKQKSVSKEESFEEISAEEALEAQKELEHSLSQSENLNKSSDSLKDTVKSIVETNTVQTKEEFIIVDSKDSDSFQRVVDQFIESPRSVDSVSGEQTIPEQGTKSTAHESTVQIGIEKLDIPAPIKLVSEPESPVSPSTQKDFNTIVDAFIVRETFSKIIQDQQVPENKEVVEIVEEEIPISIPASNTEVPSHQYRYSNLTETYFTPPSNNSQQKLTSLTSKFNLDLDSLITREEELFNLEEKKANNIQSAINDNEPADFKTKLRYFNSISSPSTSSNPFIESQSSSTHVPLSTSSALNKRYFDDPNQIKYEDDYDFAQVSSLPRTGATTTIDSDTPENFELIKVSIINKRPITPDIDEVLNDTCEEHYLDRSFPYTASMNGAAGDDLNGNYMYDQKRLSSLDPSIANEYDPGMSSISYRSSSIYLREINKNGTAVPISIEHQRTFRDSNPFWTQDSVSLKSNQRYTSIDPTTGTYNTVGYNRKSNGSAYETYESSNRGSYNSGSMYNAYNNNTYYQPSHLRDGQQPLNPATLNNYNTYQIDIQNRPSHLPPERSKDINIAIISSDTLEKNKLIQQKSDDDPLFRHDMHEIQQEALKNFNKRQPMIDSEYEPKTYDAMTSSKLFIPIEGKKDAGNQPPGTHGISHLFTRIVNVFRLPFNNKKSQIKDNQSQAPVTIAGSNITKSRSEYKQHLLNEQDELVELEIEREGKVFTIAESNEQTQGGKSSKSGKHSSKSSSKNVHKDVTPKEVAKMRKSKTQQDVKSTTSGWKCCLF